MSARCHALCQSPHVESLVSNGDSKRREVEIMKNDSMSPLMDQAHMIDGKKQPYDDEPPDANPIHTFLARPFAARAKVLATLFALLWCLAPDRLAWSGPPTEVATVAGFGLVSVYAPRGTPSEVVL